MDPNDRPSITVGGSSGLETVTQTQNFTWSVTDSAGLSSVAVQISKTGGGVLLDSTSASGSFNFDSYGTGFYSIKILATNADGDWTRAGGDNSTSGAVQAVTVIPAQTVQPVLSNLASPTIVQGTPSVNLSGKISLGASIPSGAMSIALNGVTHTAPINPANGTFSSTFATNLPVGSYTINYSYAGDTNFSSVSGTGTLLVQTPAQATQAISASVAALVNNGTLSAGNGNALTSKLDAAINSLNGGNLTAANNQLQAFINQLSAFLKTGKLTADQEQFLLDQVNAVLAVI